MGWKCYWFYKKLFGINSPSRLFRDEIGTNLALGIGEGFSDTMDDVTQEMANAIPTEFDTTINSKLVAIVIKMLQVQVRLIIW